MKNKSFWAFATILGFSVAILVYTAMTTGLLVYNLKNRGILTPNLQYNFALSSLNGDSVVLYDLTLSNWPHISAHKLRLTPKPNGFSAQIRGLKVRKAKTLLAWYDSSLLNKLAQYQPNTHFVQEWPISLALFNLIPEHSVIDLDIQKLQTQSYQVNVQASQQGVPFFSASVLISTSEKPFRVVQGQAEIQDDTALQRIQEYAQSKHQPLPQKKIVMSIQQNKPKTGNPDSSKQPESK